MHIIKNRLPNDLITLLSHTSHKDSPETFFVFSSIFLRQMNALFNEPENVVFPSIFLITLILQMESTL